MTHPASSLNLKERLAFYIREAEDLRAVRQQVDGVINAQKQIIDEKNLKIAELSQSLKHSENMVRDLSDYIRKLQAGEKP